MLPTDSWWVVTYASARAIDKINGTFVVILNRALLIAQQEQYIQDLMLAIILMYGIQPYTAGADYKDEDEDYVVLGDFKVQQATIIAYIQDQGSFPTQCFDNLTDAEKDTVVQEIASYMMQILKGLDGVKA
jgi:hypothetical protein